MAQFVNENEDIKVQDTLIDFGELGRWSKETLNAHTHLTNLDLTPFEQMYKNALSDYDNQIMELSNWKVGFRTELRDISWRLERRNDLFNQRDKLVSDFQKYLNMFPDRQRFITRVHTKLALECAK
jgi:hypothetical protein